ncbi:hypothetical protein QBC32DRAFT_337961 [Pseudoneurospora amorphoporcata]|uniref:F-box domain-containing protein n=1 Tax=Pseudoneurospora amorphoporcata TaxID=241081 RepID=A0AAN6SHV5_9PEZI|nr:hypothetical protein QBC32DRAFT_337961 [Pseudoneurospora amorphoporcata]
MWQPEEPANPPWDTILNLPRKQLQPSSDSTTEQNQQTDTQMHSEQEPKKLTLLDLPPEILHHVCSHLPLKSVRSFRLTNRLLGEIGACHALPELIFYLHTTDFAALRSIASHPIYPRYVRSLIYGCDILPTPRLNLKQYVHECRRMEKRRAKMHARHACDEANRPPKPLSEVKESYREYKRVHQAQEEITSNDLDYQILKEVVGKMTNLQEVMVSSDFEFRLGSLTSSSHGGRHYGGGSGTKNDALRNCRTPFDKLDCLTSLDGEKGQEGVRHLRAILMAVKEAGIELKSLCAGLIHWSFFNEALGYFGFHSMGNLLTNLTRFELLVLPGPSQDPEDLQHADAIAMNNMSIDVMDEIFRCQGLMRTGVIRKLVSGMPNLEVLSIGFMDHAEDNDFIFPARLQDVIPLDHTFPNLESLKLEGLETERQELTDFVVRHKDSLMKLELRDMRLVTTSWRKLLPELRYELKTELMEEVSIYGMALGMGEEDDDQELEEWFMGDPEDHGATELATRVQKYFMDPSKTDCPLSRENMEPVPDDDLMDEDIMDHPFEGVIPEDELAELILGGMNFQGEGNPFDDPSTFF